MAILDKIYKQRVRHFLKDGERFIVANWHKLPIRHDILRNETRVYNEKIEGIYEFQDTYYEFIKVKELPTEEEAKWVEWRVIDLINNFKYSHTPKEDLIVDLNTSISNQRLNLKVLQTMASKYGTEDTQLLIAAVGKKINST